MQHRCRVGLVPVAIIGARRLRFRRPVYVRAERPIEWSEIPGEKRKEQLAEMERRGMERVYALRDQMRADYPGVD